MQGAGGNAVLFTRARRDALRQTGGGAATGRERNRREGKGRRKDWRKRRE